MSALNKLQIPQYLQIQEFEFGLSRNTEKAWIYLTYNFMACSTNNTTYMYKKKKVCFPKSQQEPLFLGYGLQYGTTET
jgi:hypothetical protein